MINNKFEKVFDKLREWNNGGERKLSNGTRLICHLPRLGPEAWLHEIYAPLIKCEIEELQEKMQVKFPIEFKAFLMKVNGLNIFSDSLCIGGRRTSYVRSGDESIQPYDLLLMNEEKSKKCPKTWICFGGYS